MKKLLITLLAVGFAVPVFAATATTTGPVTVVPPTEYVNGDAMPRSDIQGWRVSVGRTSGVFDLAILNIPVDPSDQHEINIDLGDVSDGDVITLFMVWQTVDVHGHVSAFSNEVAKSFSVSITRADPNPPSISWPVTIACTTTGGESCVITEV